MDYNKTTIKELLPQRPADSNKGTFGHVLNFAGCYNYRGAAYFSSVSALKVGCGRVTLASEHDVLSSCSALSPDIILHLADELKDLSEFQAVSIGCGLSQSKKAVKLFERVMNRLKDSEIPLVIDADGLNILAKFKKISLPKNTVLTPHPREMSRIMGVTLDNILFQPEFWVKLCSEKYNCTTVLKLHKTLVADSAGNFYENTTGNSALAHGGSGDVLCGMISGFLTQGLNAFDASCLAVYLHAVAAEIASEEMTQYSVSASDLINYIPQSIKRLL